MAKEVAAGTRGIRRVVGCLTCAAGVWLAIPLVTSTNACGQAWRVQPSGVTASLRGLSVWSDEVAWASGQRGTVIRTTDGGGTWERVGIPDDDRDYRDVAAWGPDTAVVVSAGAPAFIQRTTDGGQSWERVYADDRPAIFLDGMSFWDERNGIVFGDPIDDRLVVLRTMDGGQSWLADATSASPVTVEGEAGFAASGTCLCTWGDERVWIGLGGGLPDETRAARVFRSADRGREWQAVPTPLAAGPSAGIFSVAFADAAEGVAVGGDYLRPRHDQDNAAFSTDGGATWSAAAKAPRGYRSAVAIRRHGSQVGYVAVGPTGTDYSLDGGRTWHPLGGRSFHAVSFAPAGGAGWAVGSDGVVARWVNSGPLPNPP